MYGTILPESSRLQEDDRVRLAPQAALALARDHVADGFQHFAVLGFRGIRLDGVDEAIRRREGFIIRLIAGVDITIPDEASASQASHRVKIDCR